MAAMISSRSGCSIGSPPESVRILVPRSANLLIRPIITSFGTGGEKSSYSLQYVQDRLQRRMGIMCAMMGWSVLIAPRTTVLNSRSRRVKALAVRRSLKDVSGIPGSSHYNTDGLTTAYPLRVFPLSTHLHLVGTNE